jgi:PAS domain S-box-containing protein
MVRPRMLVVEDELIVGKEIEQNLKGFGYDVIGVVAVGEVAVALASEERPDLILMDIHLRGEMDGISTAREIRKVHDVPVIFLTAYSDDGTIQRATLTEPYGYLLKPYQPKELHAVVETTLMRHRAERRLKSQERHMAATLRSMHDPLVTTDATGRVTFMNPAARALTGWDDAVLLMPAAEALRVVDARTGVAVPHPVAEALRTRGPVALPDDTMLLTRDGRQIPVDDSAAPLLDDGGGITGVVLVFQDASRRRTGEGGEGYFQESLAEAGVGIAHVGVDRVLMRMNRRYAEILGYPREGLVGRPLRDIIPAEDLAVEERSAAQLLAGELKNYSADRRYLRADGSPVWVNLVVSLLRDRENRPQYFIEVIEEITERKLAEFALVESRDRFEKLFHGSPIGISVVRLSDGRFVDVNESFLRLTGYRREEMIGKTGEELRLWDEAHSHAAKREMLRADGLLHGVATSLHGKAGRSRTVVMAGELIEIAGEACLMELCNESGDPAGEAGGREKTGSALRSALSHVETLTGLLSICASCKKVRDAEGYWNPVEKFIVEHTDARLTHGICPDCARRLYPELFEE